MHMKYILSIALIAAVLVPAACQAQSVSKSKSAQLTVYNGGFALVKDTRTVTLKKGINSIEVADVAAQIDPTSILFKTLTAPNSVAILEQNYQYDLISPDNILNKSVGEKLFFTTYGEKGITRASEGTLLCPPQNGGIVIKDNDGTVVLRPSGEITLRKLPEGLKSTPTLNWLLASDEAGSQDSEISYITNGIGWKADYVALVNKDDTALDLTGWVSLNNNSGTTYKDAKLTLMAGDVRTIQPQAMGGFSENRKATYRIDSGAPQFEEKSFFEYHMYTMERPTTIADKETKQLSLLSASDAPVKKEMIYDARGDWFRFWWYPGRSDGDPGSGCDTSNYHKVNVVLVLTNSKENHMGMPLPKGRIRVYKLDDTGSQQFVGEDEIDHTPKDEKLKLYVGNAFDVVGDYKRTNYKKIDDRTVEESFEAVIRNHKDKAVDVKVVDHVWSDWTVTEKSHDYTKKDASTIEFPISVPANGEVKITYTIRTKW